MLLEQKQDSESRKTTFGVLSVIKDETTVFSQLMEFSATVRFIGVVYAEDSIGS